MNMYVDSFDDDELEIVLDESEGIEVVLDSAAITWSEINGEITKNKSVVEFLNNLPMLPDIPTEEVEYILKANAGEATWQIDNKATQEELLNGLSEVNQIIVDGLATKQDVGDYATREELNTTSQTLQENIDTKQDVGDYATREELNTASQTLQESINTTSQTLQESINTASQTLQENINTKQDVGNYATREELTTASQTLQENINTKQDAGDYATKTQLTEGLDTKQDVGDYITKTLYDQTNEAFQNALNGKQATGDYVTNTELENKKYLTSFTEKDPIYLADKPSLALKSELPNLTPYATKEELTNGLSSKQETGNYALKSEIPNISNLASKDEIPTLVSELENDSNYATQTQVMQAIAAIPQFKLIIVNQLPETGEKMTLYFVPKTGIDNDVHDEYIWIEEESKYEYIGTTAVDLTDYVKNTDYANGSTGGVVKVSSTNGVSTNLGQLVSSIATLDQYKTQRANNSFISKGTLENIKDDYVKRGLTENAIELTDNEKTSARTWLGTANDSAVVHLAGDETITGVKTFTLPDNIKFTASKTAGYKPGISNAQSGLTPAINVPWSRNGWHDHFAFGQSFTIASKEVTTDGESWVADDRDISYLFAQKEYGATGETVQAPNAGEMGFRFVLQGSNIAYSNIQWIEIGFSYSSAHTIRLLVESSSDGIEWTEVHNSTTSASANYQYLYVGNLSSGNTYLRISVIKIDTSSLDVITRMLYVKGWTYRKGNQGRGIEYEYPYFWDNMPNLMPVKSGNNLGSTTRRWGTTYTTNLNVGGQVLNHTHITKLNNLPTTVVLTQAEYDALTTKDANTLYLIEEE